MTAIRKIYMKYLDNTFYLFEVAVLYNVYYKSSSMLKFGWYMDGTFRFSPWTCS